jgi:transcriptional regulator GlxA family with amidase domain
MTNAPTIGIVVFDGVLTAEVTGPTEVFGMASQREWFSGTKVILIGVDPQPTIRTEEGLRLSVDATIADDLMLDVLIVPGGNEVDHLIQNEALNEFIRKHEVAAQWVGSVCAGAFVLGSAGVLDGKQATTWFGGEASLQAQYPAINVVTDKPVVIDHRRVTANGGLVGYRAALVMLGQMTSAEHAKDIHRSLNMARLGTWADIEADIAAAVAEAR